MKPIKLKGKVDNYIKDNFLVSTLGIIFDTKNHRILLGKRKNDPYVSDLTWSFPGGTLKPGEDPEKALERTIFEKTGLIVASLGPVFARVPKEKKDLLLLFYLCEVIKGEEKFGKDFVELKWLSPNEIEDYITTSIDPRLKEYIINLR
jgi:ADP-ribose pyrophosphatase YjhB (NUDIX family)